MAKISISDRKAKLEAELEKIKEQERIEDDTRFKIIGRVVSSEMANNQELMNIVGTLLERELKNSKERSTMGLEPLKSNRGRPALAKTE